MALQGTIETFALPEVLRLLGSGSKTGRLRVSGDRGSGSVWIDSGRVVGAEATGAPDATMVVSVVFELLRFTEGSFNFDDDQLSPQPGSPQEVEVLLGDAERHLAEWQEIESVVPSLDVGLALAETLPTAEVVIDANRWSAIVAVAAGQSVRAVATALGLDELDACRRAKELVEDGLVVIVAIPEPTITSVGDATAAADDAAASDDDFTNDRSFDAGFVTEDGDRAEALNGSAPARDSFSVEPLLGDSLNGDSSSGAGYRHETYAAEPYNGVGGDLSAADEALPSFVDGPSAAFDLLAEPGPEPFYGAEPGSRSAARAELDAMASGFGLQDPVPTNGFDGFSSDPNEDPAFSFASPDPASAPDGQFDALGSASFYDEPRAEEPPTVGAALFAEDIIPPLPPPPPPPMMSSDALFAPGTPGFNGDRDPESGDAAEVARQLANLSPKAARAVAAAARASTVEEREAALAEVTSEGDEPINRGLLLKFLSSVQT